MNCRNYLVKVNAHLGEKGSLKNYVTSICMDKILAPAGKEGGVAQQRRGQQ
jgi:hypothetical protein